MPNPPTPNEPKYVNVSLRIPEELLARVDRECRDRVIGRPLVFTMAVEKFLDSLPPVTLFGPDEEPKPDTDA